MSPLSLLGGGGRLPRSGARLAGSLVQALQAFPCFCLCSGPSTFVLSPAVPPLPPPLPPLLHPSPTPYIPTSAPAPSHGASCCFGCPGDGKGGGFCPGSEVLSQNGSDRTGEGAPNPTGMWAGPAPSKKEVTPHPSRQPQTAVMPHKSKLNTTNPQPGAFTEDCGAGSR